MSNKESYYVCKNCKEEWGFFKSDYNYQTKAYPTKCPLCSMSFIQLVRDTYAEGGLAELLFWIRKRYLHGI